MREYSFIFDEGLKVGLLPKEKIRRNEPGLIEAYNIRIAENGVLPYEAITNSFSGLPATVWPYPQVFYLKRGIVLTTGTQIYTADDSYVCSLVGTFAEGGLWSCADYGDYQVFANGAVVVYRDTTTGTYTQELLMPHTISSICDFNGQVVAGNFGTGMTNWVGWSDIGSSTLTQILSPDIKNTRGFMPVGFRGAIQCVKKLGKGVMVYGTDGVSYIMPASTTFGKQDLLSYGIPGRGFISGDDKIHLFIDSYNRVHTIDANLKHNILDYSNYIVNLVNDISITYDTLLSTFYISDGVRCYRLEKGLSEIFQSPSGIARVGASIIGKTYDDTDVSAYFTTNTFDMQNRSIKFIQTVEASINTLTAQGAVDYAYTIAESMLRSRLRTINKKGVFTPGVSGVDLRVHIVAASYIGFALDYLVVHFKNTDKTTMRGPHAEPTNM